MAKKILDTGIIVGGARKERVSTSFRSPDEQQKIAECLSSIDQLIGLYVNKVTLLEQHKKGLIRQLFPKHSNE